jgi:hypothetical protein
MSFRQNYPSNNGPARFWGNPKWRRRNLAGVGGEYALYMIGKRRRNAPQNRLFPRVFAVKP